MKKRTKYRSEENEQNKNEKSLDANRFLKKKWVKSTSREYYNQMQTDK